MKHAWSPQILESTLEQLKDWNADLAARGGRCASSSKRELRKTMGLNFFLHNRMIEGSLMPAMQAMFEMQTDVAESWLETLSGKKELPAHVQEMNARMLSGLKYSWLITHLGRKLFGSATFPGESRLAENELMTLTYIPPRAGVPPLDTALFHIGGFLPFSDRIFRALPEANLFDHFLARGIGVYAMELKRDGLSPAKVGACSLSQLIDMIDELSTAAFLHNGRRKMMMEGYCGLALPMLCYLAARPRDADAKLDVAFTMVAPVDGRECKLLHESIATTPRYLIWASTMMTEVMGGYVPGTSLQTNMDIPLRSLFFKSHLGRFAMGWKQQQYARISRVEQLDAAQRKELAGAYWISPEHARRSPMPGNLTRFTTRLWLKGIDESLALPYRYNGRPLSLRAILDETGIQLAGFYGGKDRVVPESTAHILRDTMGKRYTHVVHPRAGHISYVLSPEVWSPEHKYALDPNPIDLVLELRNRRQ